MILTITCIKKAGGQHENELTAISHLGWVEQATGKAGIYTRNEMYQFIKSGGQAFVEDFFGNKAKLMTAETSHGTKYVKTYPDQVTSDNLLKLKDCN